MWKKLFIKRTFSLKVSKMEKKRKEVVLGNSVGRYLLVSLVYGLFFESKIVRVNPLARENFWKFSIFDCFLVSKELGRIWCVWQEIFTQFSLLESEFPRILAFSTTSPLTKSARFNLKCSHQEFNIRCAWYAFQNRTAKKWKLPWYPIKINQIRKFDVISECECPTLSRAHTFYMQIIPTKIYK